MNGKAAFAQPKSPLEVGAFGTVGTLPVSTGLDQYSSIGGYAQISYGLNYYGTVGANRDEFVVVRKMRKVDWLEEPGSRGSSAAGARA